MKKVSLIFYILVLICSALFAEKKAGYEVKSVTGKVTYEVSSGEWAELKAGMLVDENTSVSIAMNSSLVVDKNGIPVTVKAMKKGKLGTLLSTGTAKSGVKMGSRVTSDVIAKAAESRDTTVTTASSRASEAKADVEWDE